MGISERKEKQKLEVKKLILDASIKLFIEEGFQNVSIRKIADLIEYSPTTVYLYFKDKNEILFQLHELGFQKMTEYNSGLWDIVNPLDRLHQMGINYVQFGLENPEFYDIMFLQHAPMEVIEQSVNCDWQNGDVALGRLIGCVTECMDQGLIIKGDAHAISMAVWGMSHGLVSLTLSRRFEKLVDAGQVQNKINESLTWFLNSLHT
jgi:AcrR family transcriptional regulator